jgi:hypothetical protein
MRYSWLRKISKLSPALKALINALNAQPGTIPAPAQIASVYANIAKEAEPRNVGLKAWFSAAVRPSPLYKGKMKSQHN